MLCVSMYADVTFMHMTCMAYQRSWHDHNLFEGLQPQARYRWLPTRHPCHVRTSHSGLLPPTEGAPQPEKPTAP